MSGEGQSKLKLSGNGNECKPLQSGATLSEFETPNARFTTVLVVGWGLHSFTSQLNLSRVLSRENTLHTLHTPYHLLNTGYTAPLRTPYPMQSAQVELKRGRV